MPYLVKIEDLYVCRGSLPQGIGRLKLKRNVNMARIYTYRHHAEAAADQIRRRRSGERQKYAYYGLYIMGSSDVDKIPSGPIKVLEVGIEPK